MASHTAQGLAGNLAIQRQSSVAAERSQASGSTRGQKLNQIVHNFYAKAAQIVIQARQPVAPLYARGTSTRRLNKWFNIDTVDTDDFREDLKPWKLADVSAPAFTRITPLVIEVVLLVRDLTPNQALVLLGDNGQRWDVMGGNGKRKLNSGEIVLERWKVDWQSTASDPPELSVTYKKSIVVFRSLFALARLLPAWKLRKKLAKSKLVGNSLRVTCRIGSDQTSLAVSDTKIALTGAIVQGQEPRLERHAFHSVETPAGKFCTSVEYRSDCNFRIDDSEALLSSQFLTSDRRVSFNRSQASFSSDSPRRNPRQGSSLGNNYLTMQTSGSNNSLTYTSSGEGRGGSSPSMTRPERRQSATYIQPFKTPSLSASPSLEHMVKPAHSLTRTSSAISMDRLRSGVYTQSQRNPNSLTDSIGVPLSGSPRAPAAMPPQLIKRYSSSFGQRSSSFSSRRRLSHTSDFANQPDSSGSRGSSRSPSTLLQFDESEDDDLASFVKLLDSRAPLTGTQFRSDTGGSSKHMSASMVQKTRSELSKYQDLKGSHAALTESLMHSVIAQSPPVEAGSSRAAAYQPSPFSPMSPHTPSIPSKLSESSVVPRPIPYTEESSERDSSGPEDNNAIARAINIPLPLSPRLPARNRATSFDNHGEAFVSTGSIEPKTSVSLGSTQADQRDLAAAVTDVVESPFRRAPRLSPSSSNRPPQSLLSPQLSRSPEISRHARPTAADTGRAPAGLSTDDDELFFAMSDIHLKNN